MILKSLRTKEESRIPYKNSQQCQSLQVSGVYKAQKPDSYKPWRISVFFMEYILKFISIFLYFLLSQSTPLIQNEIMIINLKYCNVKIEHLHEHFVF